MPDARSLPSPAPRYRTLTMVASGLWLFEVTLLAVQGGPRSAPGYNRRSRFEPCPECGEKVRVGADGWGYCRNCREEFDFN